MSREPTTVTPDTAASKVAALMVEHGYSIVPVLDGDLLIGAVTRAGLLRSAYPG
jgi:CBS domain-containing protein